MRGLWSDIESRWVDIVRKQSGDDTCQWLKPSENLSYQTPQKPFEIFEEDFRKTAVDYVLFMRNIDTKKLKANLAEDALYGHFAKGD